VLVLEYKAVVDKEEQRQAIDEAIRTTQFIRNKALRFWMNSPPENNVSKMDLNNFSTALRKEFPFVEELNSMACQAAAERAWAAISRFYENCKNNIPGKKGYPQFQKDNRSVEYKTSGWKLHQSLRRITFTDKKGIGKLKLLGKWDIHTYPVKSIKRVRIVKRADGYYVQFCLNIEVKKEPREADGEVGLDVGLEYFYSDSNGHHEENPRFFRKAEKGIKRAQKRISKKKKGSANRRKARQRYTKKHLRVSRQRKEHAKRLARCVCKTNVFVAYEDLNIRGMVKNHCLAKSISDASWYLFRQWLQYFAQKFECTVVRVHPAYTSQNCSSCGQVVKKSLSTRTHTCQCGCVLQRDVNAAINILNRAKSREGHSPSQASGVGTTTLVGESLLEQVLTVNEESPGFTSKQA
jgi:putative transposase